VVFADAMKQFPEQVWAAANHAVIATRRQDWQEALQRWQNVRDRFPHEPMGYIGYGEALRDIGRIDEAERTFSEAEQRFPDNDLAAINLARIASRRGERVEAIRRWEAAKARFPFNALIFIGLAEAFTGFEQFGAADEVLAQAVESFPANESVWIAYARVAMQQRHWDAALRRWDLLLQRFPQHRIGYSGKAEALSQAGQFDAAKVTLEEALRLFPEENSLMESLGELAGIRERRRAAQEWWHHARHWFAVHTVPYTGDLAELNRLCAALLASPNYEARLLEELIRLEAQERPELQAALFERVLARKPIWHFWIFHRLARNYETLGREAASFLVASAALQIERAMPAAEALFRAKFEYLRHHQLYKEAIAVFREAIDDAPEQPIAEPDEVRELANAAGIFLDKTFLTSPSCRCVRVIEAETRPAWSCPVYGPSLPRDLVTLVEAEERKPIDVVLFEDAELLICNGATVVIDSIGMTVTDLSVAEYPALVRQKVERLLRSGAADEISADVVIEINDGFPTPNYCHFLLDQITRLELYRRVGVDPSGALVVCPVLGASFQHEIAARLGMVNCVDVNRVARVKARELWVSSNCREVQHPAHVGASWAIDFLRCSFGAVASGSDGKIYLSRSDAIGRRIHNEEEVARELERRGFVTIVPGRMSFTAQVAAVANASHIVSVHGAALTNAIFAQPNCAVLEMFHPLYGTISYTALAQAAHWRYAALTARDWQFDTPEYNNPDFRAPMRGFGQRDIFVNLNLLQRWLDDAGC
jgi:capsular polysaccharide biosynthesis protein/tetratricopeptide (TPR) repeat protein